MDRFIPMRRSQSILSRYGVGCEVSRGKGYHLMFYRDFPEGRFTYPVPTHSKDVLVCYVKGWRRKFRLRPIYRESDGRVLWLILASPHCPLLPLIAFSASARSHLSRMNLNVALRLDLQMADAGRTSGLDLDSAPAGVFTLAHGMVS